MRSIKLYLEEEHIQNLKKYISWVSHKKSDETISDYWQEHSKKIKVVFCKRIVTLYGDSGFYVPREKCLPTTMRSFLRDFPTNLTSGIISLFGKAYGVHLECLNSFPRAYEITMRNGPPIIREESHNRLNFEESKNEILNFNTIRGMRGKWPISHLYDLNHTTIKSYFYLQILENKLPNLREATVCEIGPGSGNLASLFRYHFNNKLFLIDLPETIIFSYSYLSRLFPGAKIALPNQVESENFSGDDYDIVYMTPYQTHIIPDQSIDLVVNMHSMQEMNMKTIDTYFNLIDQIIKDKGHFFCANRTEKIMNGKPIRFFEYPWRSNSKTLIYEPDPLYNLVSTVDFYIRLEQYIKN